MRAAAPRKPANASQASGRSTASRHTALNSARISSKIARTSVSLVGNRRYSVPFPTPARRAISSTPTSSPPSANAARAASRIRARLRAASARSGRPGATIARVYPERSGLGRHLVPCAAARPCPGQRDEHGGQLGVEVAARLALDVIERLLHGPRPLVRPLGEQRVEHVAQRGHAAHPRYTGPREPGGIARAVPALVVRAGDLLRRLQHAR